MGGGKKPDHGREIRDLLIVGLIAALIVVWGGLVFFLVGDQPREWDYGSYPYVPGESYQSTERVPQSAEAPPQVQLPEVEQEPSR